MTARKGLWQIPPQILERYRKAALEKAQFECLDDRSWYAEIPGFQGVWANEPTQRQCRQVLAEVLDEWLTLKLNDADDDIPILEGIDLLASLP